MWQLIFHGPIEVLIGVAFGVFWGVLAQWIPNHDHRHVAFFRWLVLLGKFWGPKKVKKLVSLYFLIANLVGMLRVTTGRVGSGNSKYPRVTGHTGRHF